MSVTMLNFLCVHICHAAAYFSFSQGRFKKSVMAALWAAYMAVAWAASVAIVMFVPQLAKWGVFAVTVGLHIALYGWTAHGSAWKKCFFVATYLTFFFFFRACGLSACLAVFRARFSCVRGGAHSAVCACDCLVVGKGAECV